MQEALRLFDELDPKTIGWIFSAGAERTIARDETIAVEGENLGALVFVLDGLFTVHFEGHEDAPVAILGPGELIGEISFLENLPATASVVASEDSRVLAVARLDLEQRIEVDAGFAADIYRALGRVLSRRLRERSLALAASVGDGRDSLMLTPAWIQLAALLEAFKDLLRLADAAAGHSEGDVPRGLLDEIRTKFGELCQGLTQLTREVPNTEVLAKVQSALRREFVPYLHLTQLARRILVKPRGYAGDFLTIDLIYRNEPGGIAPLGPLVDSLFLERPVARAVRNRRGLLAQEIALALDLRGGSASVTSLACGPAKELFDIFSARPGAKLQATLIDIDFQALGFVADQRDAAGLTKRMRLEHGNLVYLATGRHTLDLKHQDLIYSIGLIDYFQDRFVIALLNWIHGCLSTGGKVILGNFHARNPDRALMDLVLDWNLIHRSEDDMNRLFTVSSFGRPCTEIRYEEEGINLFASCVKD